MMSDTIAGPCVVCGATDYHLSMGGQSICPSCDCGRDPEISRLINLGQKQHAEITRLRAELAEHQLVATVYAKECARLRAELAAAQTALRKADTCWVKAAIQGGKK